MKYKQQIIFGMCTSVLVWVIFVLTDLIEECILDGGRICLKSIIIMPFIMTLLYIKSYLKRKPTKKETIVWFISYSVTYVILWCVIFYLENADKFIIQKRKSDSIGLADLNGIEYTLCGFSTLIFFIVLCMIFHAIYYVIHHLSVKNNK